MHSVKVVSRSLVVVGLAVTGCAKPTNPRVAQGLPATATEPVPTPWSIRVGTHCDVTRGDPASYDMPVFTNEIDTCRMMSGALTLLATKQAGAQTGLNDAVNLSIPGYTGPGRYEITGDGNVAVRGTIPRGDKELVARGCAASRCAVTVSRPDAATPQKHRFEIRCAQLCESGWTDSRCTTQADGFSFDAEALCDAP